MPNETEISQEIFKRLDVIGESVKTGAIKFSEVAVKGAFAEGVAHAAYAGCGVVIMVVGASWLRKAREIITNPEATYSEKEDATPLLFIGVVSFVVGAAIFMANLDSAIMGLVSPEWVALQNVLQLVK